MEEGSYDTNRSRTVRGTVPAFRFLVEDRDASQGSREPSNPLIEHPRCNSARFVLHENASAYSRLLPVLQQAHGARSRAGQEPPAVRTAGGPAPVSTGDRGVRRLSPTEARGPREADEEDPSAVPVSGMPQGPPAARHPREEVRARGGAQVIPKPTSQFLRVKCEDCGNVQIVFDRAASVVLCPVCGATVAKPTGGKAAIRGEILGVLEKWRRRRRPPRAATTGPTRAIWQSAPSRT